MFVTRRKTGCRGKVLASDFGLENLVTCVISTGTSFIMDGRKLKFIISIGTNKNPIFKAIAAKQIKRLIGSVVLSARETTAFRITFARLLVTL